LEDYYTFDGHSHINQTISLSELTKMFKDAKLIPAQMTVSEL